MNAVHLYEWRLPGCDVRCYPRVHSPQSHEEHGRLLEREEQGRRDRIVRTGSLEVNLSLRTATVRGAEIALPIREWELLAYYAGRPNTWCTGVEITDAIWTYAHPHTVNTTRARLRRRLGEAGSLIETRGPGTGHYWTRLKLVEVTP